MRIAIGSNSANELAAAQEAWKIFASGIMEDTEAAAEFLGYRISSRSGGFALCVGDLMRSTRDTVEELMLQLKREKAAADYYLAVQSGFNVLNAQGPRRQVFLESWAYVSDGHAGQWGHSAGISVPAGIADPVIDRGIDLSIVMERFAHDRGLHSDEGCWGLLTRDILGLKHSFVVALLAAFAPFYNPKAF